MLEDKQVRVAINNDNILFFDLDGTLVDTNLSNFTAYKHAIDYVLNSDSNLSYNPHKRFNRSQLKSHFDHLTDDQLNRIIYHKESLYDDYLHLSSLIEANVEVLNTYFRTNLSYLITNSREDRALKTLRHFGLSDKFTKSFFRIEDFNNRIVNKYANALGILGIQPNNVIVFENELSEIDDAISAGITIINPLIA